MGRSQIIEAVDKLKNAGVIVHATEGVWGLACDPWSEPAVTRLLTLKSRPVEKGLIVIGASAQDFRFELDLLSEEQKSAVLESWPGPATWLVPSKRFPAWIMGKHPTVAIRVPGHEQARMVCEGFGSPLVSTSANPNGRLPALTEKAAAEYFLGKADYILSGEVLNPGEPSVIRGIDGRKIRG